MELNFIHTILRAVVGTSMYTVCPVEMVAMSVRLLANNFLRRKKTITLQTEAEDRRGKGFVALGIIRCDQNFHGDKYHGIV